MNGRAQPHSGVSADVSLAKQLSRLDSAEGSSQERANTLLARIAWSRLAEPSDGVAGALLAALGAERALELIVRHPNAKQLDGLLREHSVTLGPRTAEEALGRWLPRLDRAETVRDIERAVAAGMRVVVPGDRAWPVALDDLGEHRPIMLWVRGDPAHLSLPSLGVVGARAASGYGSHITAELVDGACAAGLVIVSGGAYGIDAVAHRTALAAGTPTIAMVAGGADHYYPQAHTSLFERITKTGAVCAEMVPGSAPTRWRFLLRNRLIAALSRATLVTEAGIKSGSLNTASHALQLGRPVGAVPGAITTAASAGCHKLIRDFGAMMVTTAQDVCELAGVNEEAMLFVDCSDGDGNEVGGGDEARDSAWHRRVLDALPLRGSRELAAVTRSAGLTESQTRGVLAELELLGRVQRRDSPGGAPPKWALMRAQ